ncbi:MAG: hypothetical protein HY226_01785 [Candidatus Vogelbacteria bacterium]|nr:hypothetical protein [Candidatus Vogelbacteria bacterium]
MKVLITAGSTQAPIDEVRAITNIFKGRTGTQIAEDLTLLRFLQGNKYKVHPDYDHGFEVTLLTSNEEIYKVAMQEFSYLVRVESYRTFSELMVAMEHEITTQHYDLVIHSSAVSDYETKAVYRVVSGAPQTGLVLEEVDHGGKIPSGQRIFLELDPTEKIVDKIKKEWGFSGTLVMFKLQRGITDEELIERAKISMIRAGADFIVANCLEWYRERAYIISSTGNLKMIQRHNLTWEILEAVKKV